MPSKQKETIYTDDFPYSPEAERNILGMAILDPQSRETIIHELTDESYFFLEKHQIIYRAILNIIARKATVESASLLAELRDTKKLELIGGAKYILQCTDEVVTPAALKTYLTIVQNQTALRRLLTAIRSIDLDFKEGDITDLPSFINESEGVFKEALKGRKVSDFSTSTTLGDRAKEKLEAMRGRSPKRIEGLETGFHKLDKITGGLKNGEVTILAARPNLGKTSLALNIASRVAHFNHTAVAIFSLETENDRLFSRLVAAGSTVDLNKISKYDLQAVDRQKIYDAIKELSALDLYFDSTPRIQLPDLVNKCNMLHNRLIREGKQLGLIVVDYLTLIEVPMKGNNNTPQEAIRRISAEMKALAQDLKVPILLLSQLSRKVEDRGDKPKMSDLRESGNLEQDADVVILLHRDDYQKESKVSKKKLGDKKPSELTTNERAEYAHSKGMILSDQYGEHTSIVEVIVAKNRNGDTGSTYLLFHRNFAKYEDMSEDLEQRLVELGNYTGD